MAKGWKRKQAAADWRGIVALETEALARDLRGAHPGMAGAIHGALGLGFKWVGQYARAIALHAEHGDIGGAGGPREGGKGVRQPRELLPEHGGVRAGDRAA